MKNLGLVFLLVLIVSLAVPQNISACPVCYGAADSPMLDGMNAAILALIGITGSVFAGIGSFFLMMMRRSRILNDHSSGKAVVNQKGIIQWNNS